MFLIEVEKTMKKFPQENKMGKVCKDLVSEKKTKSSFHSSNPTLFTSIIMTKHFKVN
jgi:hypothetical protein